MARFADRDSLDDTEVCTSSKFETGEIPVTVDSEEADDVSGSVGSRRDSALTLRLPDAVKRRSQQTKRGKRRHSDVASDDGGAVAMTTPTSAASKTSSLTPKRRGKGAAIYVNQQDTMSLHASTRVEDSDNDDFVIIHIPPSRRSKWMDADLETTEQRAFICELTRPSLASLEERFGSRVTEGRSMPRRRLVDLTDCQEELITLGDLTDERIKSMSAHSSDEALPHRLFLVVEELDPLTRRFTSDFGHMICRFVAVADYAVYIYIITLNVVYLSSSTYH